MKPSITLRINIIFLLLLLLVQASGARQVRYEVKDISLSSLGFSNDIVLSGQKPYQAFYFQYPRGTIAKETSFVELRLRFSEVLDRSSIIRILVNDLPVRTNTLKQLGGNEATIRIPLRRIGFPTERGGIEVEKPRYLKVVIAGLLIITGDACKDIESNALYIVVKPSSFVRLGIAKDQRGISIASFLNDISGDVRVVLSQQQQRLGTLQSALWLMKDLQQRMLYSPNKVSLHRQVNDALIPPAGNYVVVEDLEGIPKLPKPFGIDLRKLVQATDDELNESGVIFLYTVADARILYLTGKTEREIVKAMTGFLRDKTHSSMLGRVALVKNVEERVPLDPGELPLRVTMKEMGYATATVQGLGVIRSSFTVLRQALGYSPRDIVLHLYGSITTIGEKGKTFLNVFLNDLLLESWSLTESGLFNDKVVSLPDFALRSENKLDVEFIHFPGGDCNAATFTGQIFDISYFAVKTLRPSDVVTFEVLPELLAKNTILVMNEKPTVEQIEVASTLLSLLDRDPHSRHLYPRLVFSTSLTNEMVQKSNVIAIIEPSDTAYRLLKKQAPLDMSESFRIISGQDKSIMFEMKPLFSLGVLHAFPTSRNTTALLALSVGRNGLNLLKDFSEVLSKNPRLMDGDIGIFGENENVYFFNTAVRTAEIEYPGRETLLSFIERNQLAIFAVLWIAFTVGAIGLSFYARRRTYKSIESTPGS